MKKIKNAVPARPRKSIYHKKVMLRLEDTAMGLLPVKLWLMDLMSLSHMSRVMSLEIDSEVKERDKEA